MYNHNQNTASKERQVNRVKLSKDPRYQAYCTFSKLQYYLGEKSYLHLYDSTIKKKNQILPLVAIWMKLMYITLSEISQEQKKTNSACSYSCVEAKNIDFIKI
jgi:hypothetical protein